MAQGRPRSIRLLVSATIVAGVAGLATTGPGGALASGKARENCGTYRSESIYSKAKVIAIRGVDCDEARKVAKKYDHKGLSRPPWECFLSHSGGRRLFSCGYGGSEGDVRDFPHALVARGLGQSKDAAERFGVL